MKIAVIVVAYNRPDETKRLIDSICSSDFSADAVDLIIDVDKGPRQEQIIEKAKQIDWTHGAYRIVQRPERMGLRPHILSCGEYTDEYDAVIVLEDDLVVSPSFYQYAKSACAFYDADPRIAQISLYAYAVNEFESRPFYPAQMDCDGYVMQVVQSWGECWTKRMWNEFRASKYYTEKSLAPNEKLHHRVNAWRENSWKKVFFNYLIETEKFVVYPYCSYTTNYTVAGEHAKQQVPDYHVVLQEGNKEQYRFVPLDECVKYDAFFERIPADPDLCMDLYGAKKSYEAKRFVASTKSLPYQIKAEYGLLVKPHENNLFGCVEGKGIYLYDTTISAKAPNADERIVLRYDFGFLPWRRALTFGKKCLQDTIKGKLFK